MNQYNQQPIINLISYQKIIDSDILHPKWCHSIAINQSSSLLIAGANEQIKVFMMKQGRLKEFQILSQNQKDITALNFFSNKLSFVSGSEDNSIIISQLNLLSNPKFTQKLKEHSQSITCLLIYPIIQNLIIFGSSDKSIKFWISPNTDYVYGLSINEKGNQLISCGRDSKILIIESYKENIWKVKQTINSNGFGYRISFVNNNIFTFQQFDNPNLLIFTLNSDGVFAQAGRFPVENGRKTWRFYQYNQIQSKY